MSNATARDWAMALPEVGRLVWRVMRDKRVPVPLRAGLVAVGAYVVVPYDVVPDWIPLLGRLDDIVVGAVGMRMLLSRVDQGILLEHWSGHPGTLEKLLGVPAVFENARFRAADGGS